MKGFRVPPQPTKKQANEQLQTELANLQMAGRISQMMTQQLMQSVKSMSDDLGSALNQVYELQYKLDAVTRSLNLDPVQLNTFANEQRLVDFEFAAAKEDGKANLLTADTIGEDSTIVITSTAVDEKGKDAGIFRSRLKLSECGVPSLIAALQGKAVGDKVQTQLNGLDHTVEVLSIKNPAPAIEQTSAPELQVVQ